MMHGDLMTRYWLMKSEPNVYPWEQLIEDGSTHWDGVRNYQARNLMRDEMSIGDLVLFYHSNCKPPHVAGIARVCKEGTLTTPREIRRRTTSTPRQHWRIHVG